MQAAVAELSALTAESTLTPSATAYAPAAMSVDETAEHLGLGRSTVLELIKTGELPSMKIGSRRLVRPADAEAFLASKTS